MLHVQLSEISQTWREQWQNISPENESCIGNYSFKVSKKKKKKLGLYNLYNQEWGKGLVIGPLPTSLNETRESKLYQILVMLGAIASTPFQNDIGTKNFISNVMLFCLIR